MPEESKKYIALTFDDGPNTTTTREVLDILEKYNVIGTFFLIGDRMTESSESSVRRAVAMGCDIENHSRTHCDMRELSAEEIRAEIKYTDDRIYAITGSHTEFFRPPYIYVNDTMTENIDLPFICGIHGRDWEPDLPAEERARLVLEKAENGSLVLLHDLEGNTPTVKALDTIIPELKNRGFEFLTVRGIFKKLGVTPKKGIVYSNVFQQE